RLASLDRARRRADRRRRHPFVRAREALSRRGPAGLERADAVARRRRLAAILDRPLDDDRGRARGEVCALSDWRRQRAGPPPYQLGGGRARLGRRNATAAQGGLVAPGPLGGSGPAPETLPH